MATARRASVVDDRHQPPAFEPAAEIELDELREAQRDPRIKALLKKAEEVGERVEREGRRRW